MTTSRSHVLRGTKHMRRHRGLCIHKKAREKKLVQMKIKPSNAVIVNQELSVTVFQYFIILEIKELCLPIYLLRMLQLYLKMLY